MSGRYEVLRLLNNKFNRNHHVGILLHGYPTEDV